MSEDRYSLGSPSPTCWSHTARTYGPFAAEAGYIALSASYERSSSPSVEDSTTDTWQPCPSTSAIARSSSRIASVPPMSIPSRTETSCPVPGDEPRLASVPSPSDSPNGSRATTSGGFGAGSGACVGEGASTGRGIDCTTEAAGDCSSLPASPCRPAQAMMPPATAAMATAAATPIPLARLICSPNHGWLGRGRLLCHMDCARERLQSL